MLLHSRRCQDTTHAMSDQGSWFRKLSHSKDTTAFFLTAHFRHRKQQILQRTPPRLGKLPTIKHFHDGVKTWHPPSQTNKLDYRISVIQMTPLYSFVQWTVVTERSKSPTYFYQTWQAINQITSPTTVSKLDTCQASAVTLTTVSQSTLY
jgi:hypothetical protein